MYVDHNPVHHVLLLEHINSYSKYHYGIYFVKYIKLEALRERRPPWPRLIITPILSNNVNVLSLGSERLTPKALDHYLHHDLVMLLLLVCFFAHLLILEYSDHHQNVISSSLY